MKLWLNEHDFIEIDARESLAQKIAVRSRSLDWMGIFGLLPDPDPVLQKTGQDITVYRQLLSDAHVWSCYQSRKSGTLSCEWEIRETKEGSVRANKQAYKIIDDLMENLDAYQIITDMLEAPFFGMAPLEILWKSTGQRWLPEKVEGKPPEWFGFSEENELRFLSKENMIEGEELPDMKFLLPRHHSSYQNPYGERVLSKCFWPVAFKRGGFKFWAIFTEKYGMPWAIGKVPRGTNETERTKLLSNLVSMVQDAVAVINDDESVVIEEAKGKGASADIYNKLISVSNREISKAILGQTLTTEIDKGGSYAATKEHMEVRADLVDQDKRMACGEFKKLFSWIIQLNSAGASAPEFKFFEEEDIQKDRAERDKTLNEQGVNFTPEYYRRTYNLEEGDFEIDERRAQEKEFAEKESLEAELVLEKERQKFVGQYLAAISAAEQGVRADALKKVVSMMEIGGTLTEKTFTKKVYDILESSYSGLDKAALSEPLKDCYQFYRLKDISAWAKKPPIKFTWGGVDNRTLSFLERLDNFYLGKYIKNTDMNGPVLNFLKEQYLEKGAGLFGRANIETINEFRGLFSDKLTDLSNGQIQRICDTSVERMRSYGNIQQLNEAAVEYARVVAVLDGKTSDICLEMNNKKIPVARIYKTMEKEIGMSPDEFETYLKEERVTIQRAEQGDAFPPYHPRCRTRVVMEIVRSA